MIAPRQGHLCGSHLSVWAEGSITRRNCRLRHSKAGFLTCAQHWACPSALFWTSALWNCPPERLMSGNIRPGRLKLLRTGTSVSGRLPCRPPTTSESQRSWEVGEDRIQFRSPPEQQMCPQEQLHSLRLSGFQKNLANGPHCWWSSNPGESTWRLETSTEPEASEAETRLSRAVFLTWEFSSAPLTVLSSYPCIKGKEIGAEYWVKAS